MGRSHSKRSTERDRGQTNTIIAVIVIAAILIVGVGVIGLLADAIPATQNTQVTNESFTPAFSASDDSPLYTVDAENDPDDEGDDEVDGDGFSDNEVVYNGTGGPQLTEGTDYNWFPDNGTVEILNTSTTQDGSADPNGTYLITYDYDTRGSKFHSTVNRVGDAAVIGGVIVIVMMAGVILRVLRGL